LGTQAKTWDRIGLVSGRASGYFPAALLAGRMISVAWSLPGRTNSMDQCSVMCRKAETVSSYTPPTSPLAGEALSSPCLDSQPPAHFTARKGRGALIWGLSGTILSIVGFIALA